MLRIIDPATGYHVDVPVTRQLVTGFNFQIHQERASPSRSTFAARLTTVLENAVTLGLEPEFRPPTQTEIDHALAVAASRGVSLPADAMEMTWFTRDFLAEKCPQT